MLCTFETVALPLRASVSCQNWGPACTWFSKGGDSMLVGSSGALRSGRVQCDPGQAWIQAAERWVGVLVPWSSRPASRGPWSGGLCWRSTILGALNTLETGGPLEGPLLQA